LLFERGPRREGSMFAGRVALTFIGPADILAIASICLQSISQREVFAFQSALTQAAGSNIDCSPESATGGQLGRVPSEVCAQPTMITNSSSPDSKIAERFAFICPTAYSLSPVIASYRIPKLYLSVRGVSVIDLWDKVVSDDRQETFG